MKIGELAKATGLSTKTVRFYESERLLPDPARTSSGYRIYSDSDVARLEFILKAKRMGLSLREIKGILLLHDQREPTCAHVRSLMEEKLAQVEKAIQELQSLRKELISLRDESGDVEDCRQTEDGFCVIIENSSLGDETRATLLSSTS